MQQIYTSLHLPQNIVINLIIIQQQTASMQKKPAKIDVNKKPFIQIGRLTKSVCEPLKNRAYTQTIPQDKKRIMNYRLIQVEGIPIQIANQKKLISKDYFGKYGEVLNLKLTIPKDQNKDCPLKMNAYVTYESQLNSSLALLGTSGTYYNNKKITSYFGTNRYCQDFLDGQGCKKGMCFYLHNFDQKNQAQLEQHARDKHIERAIQTISKNLKRVPPIQLKEPKQNIPQNQNQDFCRMISFIVKKLIRLNKFTEYHYSKFQVKQNQNVKYIKKNVVDAAKSEVFQKDQKVQEKKDIKQLSNVKLTSSIIIQPLVICQKPQFSEQIEKRAQTSNGTIITFDDLIPSREDRMLIIISKGIINSNGRSRLGFTLEGDQQKAEHQRICQVMQKNIYEQLTQR